MVIRRVHPLSVLKFSLLFYFCLMLVFLFAVLILYWVLGVIGVLDSLSHLVGELLANSSAACAALVPRANETTFHCARIIGLNRE